MQINYGITKEEWQLAQAQACVLLRSRMRHPWLWQALWFSVFFLGGIALASSLGIYRKYPGEVSYDFSYVFFTTLGSVVVYFLLNKLAARSMQRIALSAMGPFPIEHQLTLNATSIEVRNQSVSATYPWMSVLEVKETNALIMLVVGPGSLLPIPSSAFASPEARHEFVTFARSHLVRQALPTSTKV